MPYISEELMYKLQQDIIRTIPKPKYSRKDYDLADDLVLSEGKKDYSKVRDEDAYGINIKDKSKEAAHFIPSDPDRKDDDTMMMEDKEFNPYLKDKYDMDYVDIKGEEWEEEELLRTFGQVEKLDNDQPGEDDIVISENGELAFYGGRKIVSLEEQEYSEMYEADEEGGGLIEEVTTMNRVWVIHTRDDVTTLPADEAEPDDIVRAIKIWMERESYYPTIWQREERGGAHRVEAQAVREPRPSEIEQAVGGASPTLDQAERWIQEEVVNKGRGDVWLAEKLQALVQELRIGAVYAIGKGLSAGGFTQLLTERVNRVLQQLGEDPGNIRKFLEKKEAQENMVGVPKELALQIMDWHEGMNDPAYAVGSSGIAGNPVSLDLVKEVINNFENDLTELSWDWEEGEQGRNMLSRLVQDMQNEFGLQTTDEEDEYYGKDKDIESPTDPNDTDLSSFLKDMLTKRY